MTVQFSEKKSKLLNLGGKRGRNGGKKEGMENKKDKPNSLKSWGKRKRKIALNIPYHRS